MTYNRVVAKLKIKETVLTTQSSNFVTMRVTLIAFICNNDAAHASIIDSKGKGVLASAIIQKIMEAKTTHFLLLSTQSGQALSKFKRILNK